ncbi:DegT/DnrJ/EryC1/StrS family aminotransferase [Priestia flexa]|uniref:DegT/DnrJ/EryC1/StrS family aminotransferase n=1 Tax=Priestia flexa TaxID=86664 RepID=UPI0010FBE502|nr:DegT/DnrJ/EryC1/StrS family aminotransferase [Priestia flexa]QCS53927.1 DegT/DnrJ/EryC1/StrS family aminotransferase [Priestia flexa]
MKIPFSPPDITQAEIDAVIDTLKSGWITTGPKTKKLEEKIAEYCNTSRAVTMNSATACMEMTLRLLGISEGDEVITTSYTYSASASVIDHVGAKIVLVDTAENSFHMDYVALEASITPKTKAIIAVDIAGVMCDYDKVFEIVNQKRELFIPENEIQEKFGRVVVIADAAHSFGATYNGQKSGEVADFTCFSFHAVKNFTTAEGGAVTWKTLESQDDKWYKNFLLLILHGQSKDALAKTQLGNWEYDIENLAYKHNMTDIMASIGLVQFQRYPDLLKRRKEIIEMYNEGLKNLPVSYLEHYKNNSSSSGHLYLVRLLDETETFRNRVIEKMAEKGIATNVHYKPLPMFSAYKRIGFDIKDFPNAYNMYKNEITLPLHTMLTNDQVKYIIKTFSEILKLVQKEEKVTL